MPPRPWVIVIFCGDDISFDWKSFWCRPSPPTRFILYFQKQRNSFRSRDVLSQNSQSETLFLRRLVAEISTHRGDFVSFLWSSNSMRSTETTAHLFLLTNGSPVERRVIKKFGSKYEQQKRIQTHVKSQKGLGYDTATECILLGLGLINQAHEQYAFLTLLPAHYPPRPILAVVKKIQNSDPLSMEWN